MPELPEVETTRLGISPHLVGTKICGVVLHESRLRWPVPADLPNLITGAYVNSVDRRAKYLLINTTRGVFMLHLGMSGSLRVSSRESPTGKHDHLEFFLDSGRVLRFHDPRRFGSVLWLGEQHPLDHPLLRNLGPEPLSEEFNGEYLFVRSRNRKLAVKNFIMNGQVVVGVGNIYASESLFLAGIRPGIAAGRITQARYHLLAEAIVDVISRAIQAGGTTLRDFIREDGKPGYFANELNVYARAGEPCVRCGARIRSRTIGQRSSFYCSSCQE